MKKKNLAILLLTLLAVANIFAAKQKNEKALVNPKFEKEFKKTKMKVTATMYNTNLSYSDVVDVFLKRLSLMDSRPEVLTVDCVVSDKTKTLAKAKENIAWTVYDSNDGKYTFLVTDGGYILFTSSDFADKIENFSVVYDEFLFESAIFLKTVGKTYTYEELDALNRLLLGFENSTYYNSAYKKNITDMAYDGYDGRYSVSSKAFLEMCAKAGFDKTYDGDTFLCKAVADENVGLVKLLLSAGTDVNASNKDGKSPLTQAISWGGKNIEVIKLLLDAGADVNISNKHGESPLTQAISWSDKNIEVIKLLLDAGADVNVSDEYNRTPLSRAALENNLEVIKLLVKYGADLKTQGIDCFVDAMLHLIHYDEESDRSKESRAIQANLCAEYFIKSGIDINERHTNGKTMLMLIVHFKNVGNLISLLIEKGADVNAVDSVGKTALDYAQSVGNETAIKMLKQAGAK